MSTVWFTSDEHYFHGSVIPYCRRPFGQAKLKPFEGIPKDQMDEEMLKEYKKTLDEIVPEMNEFMLENHNDLVKAGDRVYHLGDFAMGNLDKKEELFKKLNGQHFLIKGNHDDKSTYKLGWQAVYDVKGITVDGQYIWMSHYPHRSWNRSYYGAIHIFGHVHGRCLPWGKSCDIGVDAWDYAPVSYDELIDFMNQQPKLSEHARDSFTPSNSLWNGRLRGIIEKDKLGEPINGII